MSSPSATDGSTAAASATTRRRCCSRFSAAEAFFAAGQRPPVNLRFLFESEEEIGSPDLPALVRARREALACDVALSADGGMWRADVPSITVSARGLAALAFTVRGPGKDLHSGRHGGGVANPLHAAADLVASLHDGGRVAVDGFYDDVDPIEPALLESLDRLPFDEARYFADVGAPAGFGEPGYGTLARQWYRPTIEVNGLYGGYQGPGSKTVLPSEAHVKITCRLVPRQRPDDVIAKVRGHLERHCPPGVSLAFDEDSHGSAAYRVSPGSPAVQAAADTLLQVFGTPAVVVGMGGTVPVDRDVSRDARRGHGVLLVQRRRRGHPRAERVLPPRAVPARAAGVGPHLAQPRRPVAHVGVIGLAGGRGACSWDFRLRLARD